ncbi:MAG TPA: hypothetical protein VEQ58_18735 [Polyangiaceae bacterium]|nr:hypothetical protein [Polyangiaceae bacterium]
MSQEKTENSGAKAAPGDGELHKPPSMLWFVIPLAGIMLYALLTR